MNREPVPAIGWCTIPYMMEMDQFMRVFTTSSLSQEMQHHSMTTFTTLWPLTRFRAILIQVKITMLINRFISITQVTPLTTLVSLTQMHQTAPHMPQYPLATKKMSLKKNGQERNKLHLTLSLPGSDCVAFPKSNESQAEVTNETYMVMSPAGAVRLTSNS